MPLGHSALVGMMAAGIGKRLAFLSAAACGLKRREADLLSDQIAITAGQVLGTATAVLTADVAGIAMLAGYTGLLEVELAKKQAAGSPQPTGVQHVS